MTEYQTTPLSWDDHAGFYFLRPPDFTELASMAWIPVLTTEVASLIGHYVIAFRELEGGLQPIVITDVGLGRNLYVDNTGKWMSRYRPACLHGFPFCMATNDSGDRVLQIANRYLVPEEVERAFPLYGADGDLSAEAQALVTQVEAFEKGRRLTLARCQVLEEEGLITDWPLKVRFKENEDPEILPGFFRIDPEKILGLNGDRLAHLKDNGVLTFALSQAMSVQHVRLLLDRAAHLALQPKLTQPVAPSQPQVPSSLLSDDETIEF